MWVLSYCSKIMLLATFNVKMIILGSLVSEVNTMRRNYSCHCYQIFLSSISLEWICRDCARFISRRQVYWTFVAAVSCSMFPIWPASKLKLWIILLVSIIRCITWQSECSKHRLATISLPWKLLHTAWGIPWPQCRWWRSSTWGKILLQALQEDPERSSKIRRASYSIPVPLFALERALLCHSWCF